MAMKNYLVPHKCWNEEHFSWMQDAVLTLRPTEVGILVKVGSITVHLALDRLAVGSKRIGVKIVQIYSEQTDLFPARGQIVLRNQICQSYQTLPFIFHCQNREHIFKLIDLQYPLTVRQLHHSLPWIMTRKLSSGSKWQNS